MTVKTTLVPGVAWPTKKTPVKPKPKSRSKIAATNENFDKWVSKQKEPVDFKKILGDLQHARVQASMGRK